MNIVGLAFAGAVGTICRYELGKLITYQQFPLATLLINTLGSLILGFLFIKYSMSQQQTFVVLGIGFCGGFTTYSTFSLDLFKMMQGQQYLNFVCYLSSSIILGIVGVYVGSCLAKIL